MLMLNPLFHYFLGLDKDIENLSLGLDNQEWTCETCHITVPEPIKKKIHPNSEFHKKVEGGLLKDTDGAIYCRVR